MSSTPNARDVLLGLLDEAFDRPGWHGPNLRAAVRGVRPAQALWRPGPGRHSIWELVLHVAFWEHTVLRRIGGTNEAFPRSPRNWPAVPGEPSARAWKADLALLDETHARLRDAVAAFPLARLAEPLPAAPKRTALREIRGAGAHDLYHAGQMMMLRRLSEGRAA